jgi:hypothetical protein
MTRKYDPQVRDCAGVDGACSFTTTLLSRILSSILLVRTRVFPF